MKRLFDLLVSLSLMLIFFPIMLIIAIAIKFETAGPVFFRQQRVGYLGKIFTIFKFRSMVNNAEDQGPYYTKEGDNRITKVGQFLRKTSLDELPQIINVVIGDMSLVGPRPNVPIQRSGYTQQQWDQRNSVYPGVTGPAQAIIRSNGTPEERTRLDLLYVDKTSVIFDLWVILLTLKQLFISRDNN